MLRTMRPEDNDQMMQGSSCPGWVHSGGLQHLKWMNGMFAKNESLS